MTAARGARARQRAASAPVPIPKSTMRCVDCGVSVVTHSSSSVTESPATNTNRSPSNCKLALSCRPYEAGRWFEINTVPPWVLVALTPVTVKPSPSASLSLASTAMVTAVAFLVVAASLTAFGAVLATVMLTVATLLSRLLSLALKVKESAPL